MDTSIYIKGKSMQRPGLSNSIRKLIMPQTKLEPLEVIGQSSLYVKAI